MWGRSQEMRGPSVYTYITDVKFTLNFTHVLSKPLVKAIFSQLCITHRSSLHQPSSLSIAQWGGTCCKDRTFTGLLQVSQVGGHSTPFHMQSWHVLYKAIPALLKGVIWEDQQGRLWRPMVSCGNSHINMYLAQG